MGKTGGNSNRINVGGTAEKSFMPLSVLPGIKRCLKGQKIVVALLFVALWAVLAFYEGALLRRVDSLSLFLFDDLYFYEMTSVPAGMLSYVGCFLNQFFYYPALGAAIYVSLLYLVYYLTRKTFVIPDNYAFLAMMPVFVLLATNTQLGYWIFYLKLPGYYYVAVVAVILSLLSMWVYRKLGNVWRVPYLFAWVFVGYPIMGVYALVSALVMVLMGVFMALRDKSGVLLSVVALVIALLLVYFVPRWFYYYYYDCVDLDIVHYMGVPVHEWWLGSIKEAEHETESFWHSMDVYRVPFHVLIVVFVSLAASFYLRGMKVLKGRFRMFVPYVILVLSLLFAVRYWYDEEGFRIENKQNAAMWDGDWSAVVEYANEAENPTRVVVVNKNIALSHLGLGRKGYFGAVDNSVDAVSPMALKMQHIGGYDTYFYYGKMNYCYRWCMENSVEYGWRPEYLKNAVRSMIASGEHRLARKYIRILKRTMFHDSWAEEMESLLDNPAGVFAGKSEFKVPMRFYNYSDMLGTDESIEEYLMSNVNAVARSEELNVPLYESLVNGDVDTFWHAVEQKKNIDARYWDVSMMMPLIKKDMKRFFYFFKVYGKELGLDNPASEVKLPRAACEALHLFMNLDKGRTVSMAPDMLEKIAGSGSTFNSFLDAVKTQEGNLRKKFPDITEKRLNAICAEHLKGRFGNTYYYYYFFVKGIKTY